MRPDIPTLIARVLLDHHPNRALPEIAADTEFEAIGFDGVDLTALELHIVDDLGIEVGDGIEKCRSVADVVELVERKLGVRA